MLAKRTSKNRITLPKAIKKRAGAVRKKVRALELTEGDVKEAIRWARRGKRSRG
jgi:hypothetical protein